MTRIDGAGEVRVNEFPIGAHTLQQSLELRMHEIFLQFGYGFINLLGQFRIINHSTDARTHVDENHDDGMTLKLNRLFELGFQKSRCCQEALSIFNIFIAFVAYDLPPLAMEYSDMAIGRTFPENT